MNPEYDVACEAKYIWLRLLYLILIVLPPQMSFCQQDLNINIGGQQIHLARRQDVVAVRVVKPSEEIAYNSALAQAFGVVQAHSQDAGLLGIAKSTIPSGAMPSGTTIYKTTNQVQQIPVFATNSANLDVALFPEMIVQFKPDTSDTRARQLLRTYGAQSARATDIAGRYIVAMPQPASVVAAVNNMPRFVKEILYVEPNFYLIHRSSAFTLDPVVVRPAARASGMTSDPAFDDQWTLATSPIDFGITRSWQTFNTQGEGVKVAVVDDGVDLNHEDLKDGIIAFWDTTIASPQGTKSQPPYALQPDAQHGTACAGIIGARQNGIGIIGVAPKTQLIAIKAATYVTIDGKAQWVNSTAALADAIDKAVELGADIISASWGMPNPLTSPDISSAIQRALKSQNKRLVLVFAAGNLMSSDVAGQLAMDFPASLATTLDGIISVAASSPCDELKSFTSCDNQTFWASKYLPKPVIFAPGTNMETTIPGNQYSLFSGTSAATPFITGTLALLMSKEPALTRSDIATRLKTLTRTIDVGNVGAVPRVDAYCLLLGNGQCSQ